MILNWWYLNPRGPELDTYSTRHCNNFGFIRHKPDTNRVQLTKIKELWDKQTIAIHYADIDSTKADDYDKKAKEYKTEIQGMDPREKEEKGKLAAAARNGAKALRLLQQFCDDGAIIGASYPKLTPKQMIVGELKAGSRVRLDKFADDDGKQVILKTAKLDNCEIVSYEDYPVLTIQPRGTINRWDRKNVLSAIIERTGLPEKVDSLGTSQLEVVCYEYMRISGWLAGLLMPIGRTLSDIDIWGIDSDGNTVLAQVTHSEKDDIESKMERLKRRASNKATCYFFGGQEAKSMLSGAHQHIKYVSIKKAFKKVKSDPIGHKVIQKMTNPKNYPI